MPRSLQPIAKASPQFWGLRIFLALVFLTGGASRIDVQSLPILVPSSIIACAVALVTLQRQHFLGRRWLVVVVGGVLALATLHLIPLPHAFWQALPSRQIWAEIDAVARLEGAWRPLSLTPANGWHALFALFTPLAILLFGVQLGRDDQYRILSVVIGLSAISGLFGLLQVIGSPQGSLYFYKVTNNGNAVGLFANRNHAALLLGLMFPMLAIFASVDSADKDIGPRRQLIAVTIAVILVPLILITGSRTGLLTALIGLAGAALLYGQPTPSRPERCGKAHLRISIGPILAGLAVVAVCFLTLYFSRAQAIDRLFSLSAVDDGRGDFWPVALDMIAAYFPWGSGSGSFIEAYQIVEPMRLLDSTYLNHAHNDWLEIAVTFGLPGMLGLALAVLFYLRRTFVLWCRMDGKRRSVAHGRMATVAIAMIAVASVTDYPLRTPTFFCIFALLVLWLLEPGRKAASDAPAHESQREG